MRVARRRLAVALVMVTAMASARAVAAEPSTPAGEGGAPPRYPLALKVTRGAEARAATFDHRRGGSFDVTPFPETRVPVGDQALAAYVRLLAERFTPGAGGAVDGALEVESVSASLSQDAGGWRAAVRHRLVLRSAAGEELGRWEVRGQARVLAASRGALAVAFSRAATVAAARFEHEFEDPPAVVAWLQGRGVVPGAHRPAGPPAALPEEPFFPVAPGAGRATRVTYLDLALVLSGAERLFAGGGLRLGVANPHLFVQGHLQVAGWERSRKDTGTPSIPVPAYAQVDQWQAGLEGGLVVRPTGHLELRAGVGGTWLSARISSGGTDQRVAPTFLAAVQGTTGIGYAGRVRLALELRKTMGGTLTFRAGTSQATAVTVADLEAALLIGYERP